MMMIMNLIDVISFERQRFYIHQTETKHCFDLVTLENARINHPVSINMTISFQVLGLYPYGNEVLVEPSLLQLIITDDDGMLVKLTTIMYRSNLH